APKDSPKASIAHNPENLPQGSVMKVVLTAEQIAAAVAAGASADAFELAKPQPEAESKPEVKAEEVKTEAEVKAEDAPKAEATPDVAAFLRAELKDAQAELTKSAVQLAEANRQLAEVKATQDALVEIAQASLANMKIALNQANVSGLTGEALVADHKATAEAFKTKFKTGGVAAASQEATEDKPKPVVNPVFAALARSVK
ncbi:MAG TPA: hypothetical protein PLX97_01870, partial [Gemmatales bacterium]|nr:hypothetical protein [Gemmatales bacterium]